MAARDKPEPPEDHTGVTENDPSGTDPLPTGDFAPDDGPAVDAPPADQTPPSSVQVTINPPEEAPAVYYGPGGTEAPQPAGAHTRADYEPFKW